MRAPDGTAPGALRRININNLVVYNADSHFSSLITGLPGLDIEDVKLSNIRIFYRPLDSAESNIQKDLPENEKGYPEPAKFGVNPSYGFFIRHAKNIQMDNVELSFLGKETRPAIILDDVKQVEMNNVEAQRAPGGPVISMMNVKDFHSRGSRSIKNKKIRKTGRKHF